MRHSDTRYIWLPALLTVYTIVMAYLGRDMLLVKGEYFRFFGIIAAEALVIAALAYFLHKKYIFKRRREVQTKVLKKESEIPQ